ncbi:hypothetical protein AWB75_06113 [Caballeronia catudaia]|uniref:Uncharacterized protein n=1 Tax=Caballeronia catudaia TaxID=1777136 RepID=A0A158D319_9BURK|nr:hypothetical protein [Caballeronia catudaia]SAK88988.1 hypothetical protein AWB75_06113 [Caballeronia catudaia]
MVQGLPPDRDENDGSNGFERWPAEAPTAAIARVVLQLDEAITLKRRAAAARLTAQGDAVPFLPIKPSRLELAVVIALAETYGAALYLDARFLPVLDFMADYGAVKLVQRVMYGARPTTDFEVTVYAAENARLAALLRDARTAFEFLCATWPEVFMGQASEALAKLGLPRLHAPAPPAPREPPLESEDGEPDDG